MRTDSGYITLTQFTPLPESDWEEGERVCTELGNFSCSGINEAGHWVSTYIISSGDLGYLVLIHKLFFHVSKDVTHCYQSIMHWLLVQGSNAEDLVVTDHVFRCHWLLQPCIWGVYLRLVSEYCWTHDFIRKHTKLAWFLVLIGLLWFSVCHVWAGLVTATLF